MRRCGFDGGGDERREQVFRREGGEESQNKSYIRYYLGFSLKMTTSRKLPPIVISAWITLQPHGLLWLIRPDKHQYPLRRC
jgi:hypothetical protein